MERVLEFSGKWRDYQKRILDNLEYHLADNKIHVVAAPGAGKTTLGIEIIARLNKPTIILAPTITIRNQWRQRIIDAFLKDKNADIISLDIREPKFITVITYQALLAAFCGSDKTSDKTEEAIEEEILNFQNEEFLAEEEDSENRFKRLNKDKADEVIEIIKRAKVDVLCFDEAHHLRNEWWKALMYLIDNLKPKQTLALTATPPYDADGIEWERYSELCGSMDEVISIPELVKNGDLCPHQDFIHFSLLRESESEEIDKNLQKVNNFLKSILLNQELIRVMQDFLEREDVETMFEEPKVYVSIASFLRAAGAKIPQNFLIAFDCGENDIPKFNDDEQKRFLSFILFKDNKKLADNKELFESLYNSAKSAGVAYNKSIFLTDSPKIRKQIANSVGKLDSIKEIVELETNALQDSLRMVILADYIKYDDIDCSTLGVMPIWQMLKNRQDISLCVLTGSIILIPSKISEQFKERVQVQKLDDCISASPFNRDENYLKITPKSTKHSAVVELITQMFNDGLLTVMVGTQALLGEGWDAPSINSLILSSTVSSYMLSNQMRGRAIRIDKRCPDKISNIWHLASVKILKPMEIIKQEFLNESDDEIEPSIQLSDYMQLEQRFKGYEAPQVEEPYYIQNGIERILPDEFNYKIQHNCAGLKENDFIEINSVMIERALNRDMTKNLWEWGLVKESARDEQSLRTGVSTTAKMKNFYYRGGYYHILFKWLTTFGIAVFFMLKSGEVTGALFAILFFLILMIKPTYRHLRCSSPEKIMRQIGIVILETLYYMGEIKTNLKSVNIQCKENLMDRSIFFSVSNLPPEENNVIIKSIMEFLNPIENPRYLLVRKGEQNKIQTTDYHAIPAIIGQNKENIKTFMLLWKKYIGECEVIYTRSVEGRKKLLKARKEAFSSLTADEKTKKLSRFE